MIQYALSGGLSRDSACRHYDSKERSTRPIQLTSTEILYTTGWFLGD